MITVTITIPHLDTEAFKGIPEKNCVAVALEVVAAKIHKGLDCGKLIDVNSNTYGTWAYTSECVCK